jgi:phage protein U
MLMALGPVTFEITPLNPQAVDRTTQASWVEKSVVGRRPPLEFTGDGPETIRIEAKLFPEKFRGLSSLATLDTMRGSGVPHFLMRGDGVPVGWFAVEQLSEKSTYLDAKGVGRVIEVEIQCKRLDAPSADGYMAALLSLIG